MSSLVVASGDEMVFAPMFGARQVVLTEPATIVGTGQATINGRTVCVLGDEKRVQLLAQYMLPGYTPGMGLLSIESLSAGQWAPCTTSGEPLMLSGTMFNARFTPTVPAVMSSPPNTPDMMAPSMGQGRFIAQQVFVLAG